MSSKLTKIVRLGLLRAGLVLTGPCLFLFTSFSSPVPGHYTITRVVIDAGHGGHDPGCLGKKSKEKSITLGIALKLGQFIESHFPDVKVIYTRQTDKFVELHERATIANNAKADLFICIHCNSACYFDRKKKKELCQQETNGIETWVMGLNKSEANLEVSKRENEVVLLEKDYVKQYDGFDPNSPEANIIFSLYQNTFLDQSLRLASFVEEEVKSKGHATRGVKQAGFLVLYKTAMPSVLIETGFLSNPTEEIFLLSDHGQHEIAHSIFSAFKSYKNSVDNSGGVSNRLAQEVQITPSPEVKDVPVQVDSPGVDKQEKPVQTEKEKHAENEKKTDRKISADIPESGISFAVQFLTSPKKISMTSSKFNGLRDVYEESDKGVYKYTSGRLSSWDQVVSLQTEIRAKGYPGAFVVAYMNKVRISTKEARQKQSNK